MTRLPTLQLWNLLLSVMSIISNTIQNHSCNCHHCCHNFHSFWCQHRHNHIAVTLPSHWCHHHITNSIALPIPSHCHCHCHHHHFCHCIAIAITISISITIPLPSPSPLHCHCHRHHHHHPCNKKAKNSVSFL